MQIGKIWLGIFMLPVKLFVLTTHCCTFISYWVETRNDSLLKEN